MNTDKILKAATPRPWHVYDRGIGYEVAVVRNGEYDHAVNEWGAKGCFEKADAELIVLAVNVYEADCALIEDLGTALECYVATEHFTVSSRHESVRIARAALTKYYEHKAKERTK